MGVYGFSGGCLQWSFDLGCDVGVGGCLFWELMVGRG